MPRHVSEPASPLPRSDPAASLLAPGWSWREVVSALNRETAESAAAAFARAERPGARTFVFYPAAGAFSALRRAPRREKLVHGLLEGYRGLVHAAKLWDLDRRWRESSGVQFDDGASTVVCAPGWPWTVRRMLHGDLGGEPLTGGRGGSRRIPTGLGTVVFRECRRGGAVRWLGGIYFGTRPRPFEEYWTLLTARRLGLPVPEPVAALAKTVLPGVYRGAILTLELEGTVSLWEHLQGAQEKRKALGGLAAALRRIHDAGLRHPDLNLGNVLVTADAREIFFIDLDRASFRAGGLGPRARRRALARIRRSARKLDPAGTVVSDEDLGWLERRYEAPR